MRNTISIQTLEAEIKKFWETYKVELQKVNNSDFLPLRSWSSQVAEPILVEEIISPDSVIKEKEVTIDYLIDDLQPKVIVADAGMGKSHIMRELALKMCVSEKIPLFIYLNGKGWGYNVLDTAIANVKGIISKGYKNSIPYIVEEELRKVDNNRAVLLLDALDESRNFNAVVDAINNFRTNPAYNGHIIVTCRNNNYAGQLQGFKAIRIKGYKNIDILTDKRLNEIINSNALLREVGESPLIRGMFQEIYTERGIIEFDNISKLYEEFFEVRLAEISRQRAEKSGKSVTDIDLKLKIYEDLAFYMQTVAGSGLINEEQARIRIREYASVLPNSNQLIPNVKQFVDEIFEDGIISRRSGNVEFVHASFREYFCASLFAKEINSGRLEVKEAYKKFWSYVEDKGLWGLEDLADDDCRSLLPTWKDTLLFLTEELNYRRTKQLIYVISDSYFKVKEKVGDGVYNPYESDYLFMLNLASKNKSIRNKFGKAALERLVSVNSSYEEKIRSINDVVMLKYYDYSMVELLKEDDQIMHPVAWALGEIGRYNSKVLNDIRSLNSINNRVKWAVQNILKSIDYRKPQSIDNKIPENNYESNFVGIKDPDQLIDLLGYSTTTSTMAWYIVHELELQSRDRSLAYKILNNIKKRYGLQSERDIGTVIYSIHQNLKPKGYIYIENSNNQDVNP